MNNLLSATARAMRKRDFPIRSTPVDYIPLEQRRRIVEKMIGHVWNVAMDLGIEPGRPPTLIISKDESFPTPDVLESLSNLTFDILCAHHLIGTADIAEPALRQIIEPSVPYPPFAEMVDTAKNPPLPFTETEPKHSD